MVFLYVYFKCILRIKGKPYPAQEQNAIDVVMQFAIYKLGFKVENIVLFGWSIGGYTATWAAMNYPDVKGVVSCAKSFFVQR